MCTSQLEPQEYESLMNRGYRKFGMACFRPVCEKCRECRPIRVLVDRFKPDRSQRRAWRDNQQLQVKLGAPRADELRVALYNRYHLAQALRKGWPLNETDAEEYALTFLTPDEDRQPVAKMPERGVSSRPAVEISVWEGGALRALVLTDVTPNTVSAVYHYYDPDYLNRGLGTFCVLQAIELARRLERPWVYLGYYVAGCVSMAYKARFRPHEIMGEGGVWHL